MQHKILGLYEVVSQENIWQMKKKQAADDKSSIGKDRKRRMIVLRNSIIPEEKSI